MDFEKVIKKRASIRRYSSKKPKIELIIKAIEFANLAPSPGNMPILRFIIIEKPELIEQIAKACQQPFVKQAPFLVVICSDSKHIDKAYDIRAKKYIKQHAGASIENFLLKITEMKLASCWVGAFSDNTIKNALKIPEDIEVEAVLPVGYQVVTDHSRQSKKSQLENRVFFEIWKNKHKIPYRKVGEH